MQNTSSGACTRRVWSTHGQTGLRSPNSERIFWSKTSKRGAETPIISVYVCRTSSWMLQEGNVSDERLDAAGKRRGCGRRMVGTFERETERRRMSDRDERGDVGLMCREVCLGLCVMSLACPSSLRACAQGVILLQFLITHAEGTSVCQWPRGAAGRGMKLRRGLTNGERNGKNQSADPA